MTRLRAEVVVASNRAAAGVYDDTTGPEIVDFLTEHAEVVVSGLCRECQRSAAGQTIR